MKLISTNPSDNYSYIGEVEVSELTEIQEKVVLARKAQGEWWVLGMKQRIEFLQKIYDALYQRRREISEIACKEMGFPITQQEMFDLGDGFSYFKWYLENAERILSPEVTFEDDKEIHRVYFEPYGVTAIIQPWNYPFCQWSWSVVPNLLAGNTVVFKHSEEVPLTGKLIEEIVNSTALPKGVFNEVYGDGKIGEMLTDQEIDLISFTGSPRVGQLIYTKAAKKFIKAVLELGGSAPGVIFEDAEIDLAVNHIFGVRFTNNGQACDGLKRLIVHESKFDEVVEKLKKLLESKVIGNPLDTRTDFGPLVAKRQQELLINQVEDAKVKGAKVICGGEVPLDLKGAYFQPTILTDVSTEMRVWQEEVFEPVLPIVPFTTEEEAIKLANDTQYGLGSYLYTKNTERIEKVSRQIKAGMVSVNGANYVYPFNPFGGYKKSGLGREHGKYGLQELCQIKVVSAPRRR